MSFRQRALRYDTGLSHMEKDIDRVIYSMPTATQTFLFALLSHLFILNIVRFAIFLVIRREVSVTLDSTVLLQSMRDHMKLQHCNYISTLPLHW